MYRIHAKVDSKYIDVVGLHRARFIIKVGIGFISFLSGLATVSVPKLMEHYLLEEAPAKVWEADSCFNSLTKVGRLRTNGGRMSSSLSMQTTPTWEHNLVIKKGHAIPFLTLRVA
ncbi:hypothetical protein PanWU01x14_365710 [Parasponia andersonii]|uniref:Uncharacterized protein n=1 Tax=Parasponia andersonii TaxID=3476 RepID=A0A2P5A5W2_PARAD|nr:hypothetical protein PanWU01x14_365710 [Parasponia andersonii]